MPRKERQGSAARCWASPSTPIKKLEQLLRGFNAAYNARRQRVLEGKTPAQVVAERLKARRKLARGEPEGRPGPDDIAHARDIVEAAKAVSQQTGRLSCWFVAEAEPIMIELCPVTNVSASSGLRWVC